MRSKISILLMAAVLAVLLTGCKVWEDKCEELIPLPEVGVPVEPQPWEPAEEEHETGG